MAAPVVAQDQKPDQDQKAAQEQQAAQAAKASLDAAAAAFRAKSFQDKLAVCFTCHGEKGISELDGVPNLAGQPANFLEYQLVFMIYGQRKNALMAAYTQSLTDDELRGFGDYFSALPPPPAAPDDDPAATAAGRALDDGHCETCHLVAGQGDTPRLYGQREDYLIKAMDDYKAGVRTGRGLGVMSEVADGLSDTEIGELSHYFSVQSGH
jgi:cytochrome c553